MPRAHQTWTRSTLLNALQGAVLSGVLLSMAKPVLVPLALAILLSFVLTPIVALGQRIGLKRAHSVLATVCFTFCMIGLIGWTTSVQLQHLAAEVPQHKTQIRDKIERLRQMHGGPIGEVLEMIRELEARPDTVAGVPVSEPPVVVAAARPDANVTDIITSLLPALEPLASAGLVIILVIFILANREDLRDRIFSLIDHERVADTTRMLGDTASRVGDYLLAQLFVNTGFGVLFGLVTWSVGVPFAFLWGLLTALLRFIPYVGTWLAAILPMLLSFALFPGWNQTLILLVAFVVIDVITANAIEPLVFGHHIGVTPVALLIAAAFWTWIWGPIGLILSTPLTVCMVVLGQHVPRFRFLTLLLSGKPSFSPHISLYQRLLAGDTVEATERMTAYLQEHGFAAMCDRVLIPALRQIRRDRQREVLSATEETRIYEAMHQVLDKVSADLAPATVPALATLPAMTTLPATTPPVTTIVGCAAHHASEELITHMLQHLAQGTDVAVHEVSTRALPSDIVQTIRDTQSTVVFIATLPPGGVPQASYLCELLHQRCPEVRIVIGFWGPERVFDRVLVRLRRAGASNVATSLSQARSQVTHLAQGAA